MKDPDNKKKWIIDEEAAAVVQQIFALCVSGMGPTQICQMVREKHKSSIPLLIAMSKGLPSQQQAKAGANPYKWTNETVSRMFGTHRVFGAYGKLQRLASNPIRAKRSCGMTRRNG